MALWEDTLPHLPINNLGTTENLLWFIFCFLFSCFEDQFAETYTVTRVTLMFQARVHRLQFWIPGSKSEGSVVKESRAVAQRWAPLHSEAAAL